jgi:starch synthase
VLTDGEAGCVAIFPWGDVIEDFLTPIGLDIHGFANRMTGGWLFGYVAALQSAGWRAVIVCASSTCAAPTRLVHAGTGAAIWLLPGRSTPQGRSSSWRSVRQWLRTPLSAFGATLVREGCTAILVQEYEYARFHRLVRLGRSLGIPVLATFQGGDRPLSPIEALVRPGSLRKSSGLIVASAAERARIAQRYGRSVPPVSDVPNPLDTTEWQAIDRGEARRRLGLDPHGFLAINHGRIAIFRKGLDILLQAWARCGNVGLVVIGSGEDDEPFGDLLRKANLPNVQWQASYSTERALMRTWLSAADIYVTASRIEGMPVAPLEAMACGLPIVATDAQGLPDILAGGERSGGLIVAKNDPAALAEAVLRLRANGELRRRLGKAGRARVESAFSVAEVGAQLDRILRRVDTPARLSRR